MKLELQVSNRKLSQRLKELDAKQESSLYWLIPSHPQKTKWKRSSNRPWKLVPWAKNMESKKDGKICSAYTVAELGEMLPENVISRRYLDPSPEWKWECTYKDNCVHAPTEADARAMMLIFLSENKV